MLDDVMTRIGEQATSYDEYGNPVNTPTETDVFCRVRSVSRSEFYQAAQTELHPEIVFVITHKGDYNGQTLVRYRDELYDVLRTYWRGDAVELTAARRVWSNRG